MNDAWKILGIARDADHDAIRRAYARKLKVTNPEDDAEGFKALRAAYEHAIEALRWAQYDFDEEPADDGSEPGASDDNGFRWHDIPAGDAELDPATPDPFAEERARERENYRRAVNELSAALTEGERNDALVEQCFAAFRQSPALEEIDVRAAAEMWLADLLASTIPRSDAILPQAVKLFGWRDSRNRAWSIERLIQRLDEWKLIAALGQPGHRLHRGWNALTKPAPRGWLWRIKALSPGVAQQVSTILDQLVLEAPGIEYSLNKQSIAMWRDWLSKPRLTSGKLITIPIGLALVWLAARLFPDGLGRMMLLGLGGGATLMLPMAMIAAEHFEGRLDLRSPWFKFGWCIAYLLAVTAALLMPPGNMAALIVTMLAAIAAAWIGLLRDHRHGPPFSRSRLFWLMTLYLASVVGIGFVRIHPASALILGVVVPLYPFSRMIAWHSLTGWLSHWRPIWRDAGLTSLIIVAVLLVIASRGLRVDSDENQAAAFFVASTLGCMLILPSARLLATFGSTWGKIVHFVVIRLLIVIMVGACFGALAQDPEIDAGDLSPTDVVERRTDRILEEISTHEPGFTAIATGNPELYGKFRQVVQRAIVEKRRDDVTRDLNALIAEQFDAMLPRATDAQLSRELRLRLAERKVQFASAPSACVDPKGKSAAMNPERKALVFDILAHPQEFTPHHGNPVPFQQLLHEAMGKGDLRIADVKRLFGKDAGPAEQCRAGIIYLSALLVHSDADVAATVRAERGANKKP